MAGPATSAQLWHPVGLALGSAGRLFIADAVRVKACGDGTRACCRRFLALAQRAASRVLLQPRRSRPTRSRVQQNNVVRVVNASGGITSFAGTGVAGWEGLGGLATTASLNGPAGIAIDAFGNVYIAETVSKAAYGTLRTVFSHRDLLDGVCGHCPIPSLHPHRGAAAVQPPHQRRVACHGYHHSVCGRRGTQHVRIVWWRRRGRDEREPELAGRHRYRRIRDAVHR